LLFVRFHCFAIIEAAQQISYGSATPGQEIFVLVIAKKGIPRRQKMDFQDTIFARKRPHIEISSCLAEKVDVIE
jgi:hypothetical protein